MNNQLFPLVVTILMTISLVSCKKDSDFIKQENPTSLSQAEINQIFSAVKAEIPEGTNLTIAERQFIDQLYERAQLVENYYEGIEEETDWEAKYNKIRNNMQAQVDEVKASAEIFYNGNEGKTILAINSFVLMSYHALEQYMSEFMWTKLGLFAANEVRGGIVLSYVLRQVLLDTKINLTIKELEGEKTVDVLYQSNDILIGGQMSVFTDIGALGLLNHRYGPETFINETWLTQEARDGYKIQSQAEEALRAGNITLYQDLQTEAAILFGAHEQLYTLDPLWSTATMGYLAELNIWMHHASKGDLSLFGDIFIGANKFTEFLYGHVIKLSISNHDLRIGSDRVEIARHGFHTLNDLRKSSKWAPWVKKSEKKLGRQRGMYNIKGFNP